MFIAKEATGLRASPPTCQAPQGSAEKGSSSEVVAAPFGNVRNGNSVQGIKKLYGIFL